MGTATIQVRYVNPPKPGKKTGSIKGANDEMFGVFADKLGQFQPGVTYEIDFSEREYQGKIYRTVSGSKQIGGAAPAKQGNGRETSLVDAERIFVCGILNSGVRAGKVPPDDPEAIAHVVTSARTAWKATFGMPKPVEEEAPFDQ